MFIEASEEGTSICRSPGPKGELIEMTNDYVFVKRSLHRKVKDTEVVEVFESEPHKSVTFLVERDMEIQEVRVLKMSKALPGYRGDKMSVRSKAEGGKEDNGDDQEVRR